MIQSLFHWMLLYNISAPTLEHSHEKASDQSYFWDTETTAGNKKPMMAMGKYQHHSKTAQRR